MESLLTKSKPNTMERMTLIFSAKPRGAPGSQVGLIATEYRLARPRTRLAYWISGIVGRVESVAFTSPDGQRRTLAASAVVVCAWGIEHARILLCSNSVVAAGLGNQNDLVGRFLMDHPRGTVGTFQQNVSDSLLKRF